MTHEELSALYESRIPAIYPFIRHRARRDKDLEQVGCLSVYRALEKQPTATDAYLKNAARWNIKDELLKGVSLDKPHYKRELPEIKPLMNDHGVFLPDIFPADKHTDPETQVINKICVESFLKSLSDIELLYVRLKVRDGMYDKDIKKLNGWGQDLIRLIKKDIRAKLTLAFSE